ncbi:hypothetical protein O3597_02925 [Verrucosispora sp. WMMA2044]|uniref:hypothetical protein n=1 Tax=Verrucosispora sp. WMMA2044 TaxID=3016419 RepID=UPI00248C7365|nr:hypothetical protein [Verrucosispora sp. WMMA2044]WBB49477.1 hypothetical protein O3597_02925 [Verrucosispora sp. WMMA2044]
MTLLVRRRRPAALPSVLLAALLAGCASSPSEPVAPPAPQTGYHLVEELCAQLDPQPLVALNGGTPKTREWPPRPDRRMSKCTLGASRRDPVSMHVLTVSVSLAESPERAREGLPRQPKPQARGTWHEVPQLGDGAWVWILPVDQGLEILDLREPVAARHATLHVARGEVSVMLDLMSTATEVPDEAEAEALLVTYAEEALSLMAA